MILNRPHFLVVGPAKTGTTWLYEQLRHVKGFKMPPTKEVCFFNEVNFLHTIDPDNAALLEKYGVMGHEISEAAIQAAKKRFAKRRKLNMQYAFEQKQYLWGLFYRYFPRNTTPLSAYLYSLLFTKEDGIITGDISPLYFPIKDEIIGLIAEYFPQLKVVMIIRDPVERAWSNIRMNYYSERAVAGFTIEGYLSKPINRGGDYAYAITNWEKHFGPNRIQYLFYDDLARHPNKFLQQFLDFVRPGTPVNAVFEGKIGKGVEKEMEPALRTELIKKNLPQYHFLANKFGAGSYPQKWLERMLEEPGGKG